MTARGQGLFHRSARGAALAALPLCLAALAGCGSPEEPRVQNVAYCQGSPGDNDTGFLHVEFRQGSTVVATGSVSAGFALTAEVPVGDIQIYVDGVQVGAVEGPTDGPYHPPARDEVTYLHSGEGCPDSAPL
ncbi:hypothetical protein GCM10010531_42170 [Blastococcus jejuensis]|uniref:Uncharacterized protein n=1 Tax=Blastococcus jejuensis TaxID=351224 RepID=A0ABP6PNA7_9ACTN